MEQIRGRVTKPSRRPRQSVRYSARYLILVYSKTPERFDPLDIHRLVSQEEGECTIIRQLHSDSISNYLAFVDFSGKRFQTRNLGLFDIQGLHPRWSSVRSSPWVTLDGMLASGQVVWNGISRDARTKATSPTPDESTWLNNKKSTSSQWEYLGSSRNEDDIQELCKKFIAAEESATTTAKLPLERSVSEKSEIARVMSTWREGYRAGMRDGLAHQRVAHKSTLTSRPDKEDLSFLAEISTSTRQLDHGSKAIPWHDSPEQILATDPWWTGDLEPLNWECEEFLPDVFPAV